MKVLLSLAKTWTFDLEAEDNKDVKEMVLQTVTDNGGDHEDTDAIHDALRECLADDPSSVVDLEIDADDFEIKVTT